MSPTYRFSCFCILRWPWENTSPTSATNEAAALDSRACSASCCFALLHQKRGPGDCSRIPALRCPEAPASHPVRLYRGRYRRSSGSPRRQGHEDYRRLCRLVPSHPRLDCSQQHSLCQSCPRLPGKRFLEPVFLRRFRHCSLTYWLGGVGPASPRRPLTGIVRSRLSAFDRRFQCARPPALPPARSAAVLYLYTDRLTVSDG